MGQILGVGLTHFPLLLGNADQYASILQRTLASPVVPAEMKEPGRWPAPMQEQWANRDALAKQHQERMVEGVRALRRAIDAFGPDAILIFGDDQYENFREDCIPPFCVYLFEQMESRPFLGQARLAQGNVWGEPADKAFCHRGDKPLAKHVATELIERDFPISYAFTNGHFAERHGPTMLTHAFLNALLFLDFDRRGFGYPVVPIQVNCYGKDVVPSRGGTGHLNPAIRSEPFGSEFGPPGPTPASCYRLGRLVGDILAERPGKYAVMASSGWSHAFLTAKHHWLWPDVEADGQRVEDLRAGRQGEWAGLSNAEIDDSGEQEFKNWICLAGAMHGRQARVVDYLDTYIFNSDKCFALFPAASTPGPTGDRRAPDR
jgi:Catalytic LigB subunit of aromatic ring-opening dioxygenase